MFGDSKQGLPKDGDEIPYRELYPIKEAAILLGISESQAYRMADSEELPTKWLGGRRQVPRKGLLALVESLPDGKTRKRPRRKAALAPA